MTAATLFSCYNSLYGEKGTAMLLTLNLGCNNKWKHSTLTLYPPILTKVAVKPIKHRLACDNAQLGLKLFVCLHVHA